MKPLGIEKGNPQDCKMKPLWVAKESSKGLQKEAPKGCKLKSLWVTKKPLGVAKGSLRFQMNLKGCKMKPLGAGKGSP